MERRECIYLMVGGLVSLVLQNSCSKDLSDHIPDRQHDMPDGSLNLRTVFFYAMEAGKIEKVFYLVEKTVKHVPTNHLFLEERFRSTYCDEMHIYGHIRIIRNPSVLPIRNGKSRTEIIVYEDRKYEIAQYSRNRIIKLPCNQQKVRQLSVQHDLLKTASNINMASFRREWRNKK